MSLLTLFLNGTFRDTLRTLFSKSGTFFAKWQYFIKKKNFFRQKTGRKTVNVDSLYINILFLSVKILILVFIGIEHASFDASKDISGLFFIFPCPFSVTIVKGIEYSWFSEFCFCSEKSVQVW